MPAQGLLVLKIISCKSSTIANFSRISASGELEDFFSIERSGLEPKTCKCREKDRDELATTFMKNNVKQIDGTRKFEIKLPWVISPENLPNNYDYALKRFLSLEAQFKNRTHGWKYIVIR